MSVFQVLVVDDEPTAVEFICSLVNQHGGDFSVLGTAGNGQECLDKMQYGIPDVVLSDVKMPVMDGVTLARRLREEYPEVVTVIVSGYQEFEYVRGSLQNGVFDYLLKPLTPSAFASVFERLEKTLTERLRLRRNRTLVALSKGGMPDAREMRACFPDPLYDAVLVRRNGLPRRFAPAGGPEIYWQAGANLSIFGRDEMERICLRPAAADLEGYVGEIMAQEVECGNYITAVATREPFPMSAFADTLSSLCRTLDGHVVLGRTQRLYLQNPASRPKLPPDDADTLRRMEHLLVAGRMDRARAELQKALASWERQAPPLLWLERQLRHITHLRQQVESGLEDGADEHLLEDALYSVAGWEELCDYMSVLLFSHVAGEGTEIRLDAPAVFDRITGYVDAHFTQPLYLCTIGQEFGISESYLSKMFRKHAQCSFNTYLTRLRMEYAKKLLRENHTLRVKDTAGMAGYEDPFYFSRSFRAYVGMSPSDYQESQKKEESQ